jgi:hypothetical protein
MSPFARVFLFFVFFLFTNCAAAQWFVGVKLIGISFHTGKNLNCGMYKCSPGKHHRVALNLGLGIGIEYKVNNWFSFKFDHATFRDCAGKFAGVSMFNLRYTQQLGKIGDGSAGIGPFFFYRKSWTSCDTYQDEGYFRESKNKKWQTKFVWYGTELEYNCPLQKGLDLSTNLFPGIPVVYMLMSGVRVSEASNK